MCKTCKVSYGLTHLIILHVLRNNNLAYRLPMNAYFGYYLTYFFAVSCATSPLMVSLTGEFLALEITVNCLLKGCATLVLMYFTLMDPFSPGLIGLSFGQVGTVQPHVDWQFWMIRGSLPVLVNINSHSAKPLNGIVPKS